MLNQTRVSRRRFLEALTGTSAAAAVSPYLAWASAGAQGPGPSARFAYVASWEPQRHGIQVWAASGHPWTPVQFVRSNSPSAFALSPDERTLFVANAVRRFRHLPTGSVESYRIDPSSGRLKLLARVPLALSAIEPGHLALSPDARQLAVAVTGGGAYNLLAVGADGSLGAVSILRKELGSGPDPSLQRCARPGQLAFDPEGHLLASDLGADRVSSFRIQADQLQVIAKKHARPGSGPASLALHPDRRVVFVGNALDGTIRAHAYDPATATFGSDTLVSASAQPNGSLHGLALDPRGRLLVSASRAGDQSTLTAWHVDAFRPALLPSDALALEANATGLAFTPDGRCVVTLEESGKATLFSVDAPSGRFGARQVVASVPHPRALAFTHL